MSNSYLLDKEELRIIVDALQGHIEGLESMLPPTPGNEHKEIKDEIYKTRELKADLSQELKKL